VSAVPHFNAHLDLLIAQVRTEKREHVSVELLVEGSTIKTRHIVTDFGYNSR
jgi:hypothetical protein